MNCAQPVVRNKNQTSMRAHSAGDGKEKYIIVSNHSAFLNYIFGVFRLILHYKIQDDKKY